MHKCFSLVPAEAAPGDLLESGVGGQTPPFALPGGAGRRTVLISGIHSKNLYLVFCLLLGRAGKEAEGRESSPGGHRHCCSRAQSSEEGPRSKGESGN